MPQMGESIFEGTITKWLKKPGDKIQRDEPLFEISTDKVDAEIPAPAAGVLKEIKVAEGATVQVNTVVGVIDAEGAAAGASAPAPAKAEPAKAPAKSGGKSAAAEASSSNQSASVPQADGGSNSQEPQGTESAIRKAGGQRQAPPSGERQEESDLPSEGERAGSDQESRPVPARQKETVIQFPQDRDQEDQRIHSSPLVRRIAKDNNVDLGQVAGTGLGGRITKQDILDFVAQHGAGAAVAADSRSGAATSSAPSQTPAAQQPAYQAGAAARSMPTPQSAPAAIPGDVVPMTAMRKKIAERMIESVRTSAHVHNMFEVDLTPIAQLRNREKAGFEQRTGSRLTFMPFFARAAITALKQFPIINSSVEGDNIRYHRTINLGIAVALDWGLIVPVLKNAEELNFLGLQRGITDLGERARTKKLRPEEVQGGTFTITNPGSFGAVFGLPIIMQPQVAILGIGGITKQPVVVTAKDGADSIAIRSMVHLVLGYDHRVIDGAVADQFMAQLKKNLENWNEDLG
jgi:2-oxoglutarate dehydrogenase E2 component (dihydrolipoamide succinyltransferase)